MILLDTHAAIWFANDTSDLGRRANAALDKALAESQLAVSAISIWEIALLHAKKRIRLREPPVVLRGHLLGGGMVELPLTGEIALRSVDLGDLPLDPTDRFIAATAIVHDAILVTADEKLLRWRHSLKRMDATK